MFDSNGRDNESLAKELVNNWRKFDSFAMHDSVIRDSDNYAIVYTHNRDSDLLTMANTEEIDKLLAQYLDVELSQDVPMLQTVECSHWACGWVAGYAVAVYMASGTLTPAFTAMCEIARRLDNYPCLNEDKWSEMECESEDQWLADLCQYDIDQDEILSIDPPMLINAFDWLHIGYGYGYYGEPYVKSEDLDRAVGYIRAQDRMSFDYYSRWELANGETYTGHEY